MGEADDYKNTLAELTSNNKNTINLLTILADDYNHCAADIVNAIDEHLKRVARDQKLPVMYLADSIVKNVTLHYKDLFVKKIVGMFVHVFQNGDEKVRASLFKLRQTWAEIFPRAKLYELDIKVHEEDAAWPVQTPTTAAKATQRPAVPNGGGQYLPTPPKHVNSKPVKRKNDVHVNPHFIQRQQQQQQAAVPTPATVVEKARTDPRARTVTTATPASLQVEVKPKTAVKTTAAKPMTAPATATRDPRAKATVAGSAVPPEPAPQPKKAAPEPTVIKVKQETVEDPVPTPSPSTATTSTVPSSSSQIKVKIEPRDRDERAERMDVTEAGPSKKMIPPQQQQQYQRGGGGGPHGERSNHSRKRHSDNEPRRGDKDDRKGMWRGDQKEQPPMKNARRSPPPRHPPQGMNRKPMGPPKTDVPLVSVVNLSACFKQMPPPGLPPKPHHGGSAAPTSAPGAHAFAIPPSRPAAQPSPPAREVQHMQHAQQLQKPPPDAHAPPPPLMCMPPPIYPMRSPSDDAGASPGQATASPRIGESPATSVGSGGAAQLPSIVAGLPSAYTAPPIFPPPQGAPIPGLMSSFMNSAAQNPFGPNRIVPVSQPFQPQVSAPMPTTSGFPSMNVPPPMMRPMAPAAPPKQHVFKDENRLEGIPANNRIFVDGKAYEVLYIGDRAVIERDGLPHKIYFTGAPRNVVIDGIAYMLGFGDKREVLVDGDVHVIRFGAPSRELYMGEFPFKGAFGGAPIFATINGRRHEIRLGGPAPEVKIEPEPSYDLARFLQQARFDSQASRLPLPPPAPMQPPQPMQQPQISGLNLRGPSVVDLLTKLKAKGFLQPAAPPAPVAPPIPSDVRLSDNKQPAPHPSFEKNPFDIRLLKIRYDSVVSALMAPRSVCPHCGLRFESLKGARYEKHLDWHVKRNLSSIPPPTSTASAAQTGGGGSSSIKRLESRARPWYGSAKEWTEAKDTLQDLESGEGISKDAPSSSARVEVREEPAPSVPSNEATSKTCSVCSDPFEEYYDEDADEWRLKDCTKVAGKACHTSCAQDMTVMEEELKSEMEGKDEIMEVKSSEEDDKPPRAPMSRDPRLARTAATY